jgi:hypothetical protein
MSIAAYWLKTTRTIFFDYFDAESPPSKKFDGKIRGGLSKITITIPSLLDKNNNNDRKTYHRFISSVSDIIYNSRIELQDAFYTPNEIVLVLNDTDAARA